MADEWITYDQARERFGAEPHALRRLVLAQRVRTKRENRIQLFDAGEVARALEVVDQVPPPPDEVVSAKDVEQALATDTTQELGGERWLTFPELMVDHGINRGQLDKGVHERRIRWRDEGNQRLYLWADVEAVIANKTADLLGADKKP